MPDPDLDLCPVCGADTHTATGVSSGGEWFAQACTNCDWMGTP